jgi:hypothetical protein
MYCFGFGAAAVAHGENYKQISQFAWCHRMRCHCRRQMDWKVWRVSPHFSLPTSLRVTAIRCPPDEEHLRAFQCNFEERNSPNGLTERCLPLYALLVEGRSIYYILCVNRALSQNTRYDRSQLEEKIGCLLEATKAQVLQPCSAASSPPARG